MHGEPAHRRAGGAGLLLLNLLFTVAALYHVLWIPFDEAPDEWAHMHYNVEHLLAHGDLPVAGRDDLTAYRIGHVFPPRRLSACYSYVNAVPAPYLAAAGTAWIARAWWGWPPWRGARLASLAWGLVFLNALYAALRKASGHRATALSVTAATALLPQVVFVSGYVNLDAYALAVSAVTGWAWIVLLRRVTPARMLLFGAACGLVLTAKLNYLVYLPFLLVSAIGRVRAGGRTPAAAARFMLLFLGASLLVGAPGLIRNLWLYGDPTGMSFVRRLMTAHQGLMDPVPAGEMIVRYVLRPDFFRYTMESFLGRFGYMTLPLPGWCYLLMILGLAVPLGWAVAALFRANGTGQRIGLVVWAVLVLACGAQFAANTVLLDYQPQGRYLFPVLVPTALVVAVAFAGYRAPRRFLTSAVIAVLLGLGAGEFMLFRAYAGGSGIQEFPAPPAIGRLPPDRVPGWAESGPATLQTFTAEEDGLCGFWIYSCPSRYPIQSRLCRFEILDFPELNHVRVAYATPRETRYPGLHRIWFKPIESSRGRVLALRVLAEDGDEPALLLGVTPRDRHPQGRLYRDNRPLKGDLIFRPLYRRISR